MPNAPKDGTPVRLHLRDGSVFVGQYSDRWWGWIALLDPWPLIRGDIRLRAGNRSATRNFARSASSCGVAFHPLPRWRPFPLPRVR
jgi:hypothetical protein